MMGGFFISTFLVKDYYDKKSPAKVLQKNKRKQREIK